MKLSVLLLLSLLLCVEGFRCDISITVGSFNVTKNDDWPRDSKDCSWRGMTNGVFDFNGNLTAECIALEDEFVGRENCSTALVRVGQNGDLESFAWEFEMIGNSSCTLSVNPNVVSIGASNCSLLETSFSHCSDACHLVPSNGTGLMASGHIMTSQFPSWADQDDCPLSTIGMVNCSWSSSPYTHPGHCGHEHMCNPWSEWSDCTDGVMTATRSCPYANETKHMVCPETHPSHRLSPPSGCYDGYQYRLSVSARGTKAVVKEVCTNDTATKVWGKDTTCQLQWGPWSGECLRGNTNASSFIQRELNAVYGSVCPQGVVGLTQVQYCPVCVIGDWQETHACNESDFSVLNDTSSPFAGFCSPSQQISLCGHFSQDCFVRNDSTLFGNCTDVSATFYAHRRSLYRDVYEICGGYGVSIVDNKTCTCYNWTNGLQNSTELPCYAVNSSQVEPANVAPVSIIVVPEPAPAVTSIGVLPPASRVVSICDHVLENWIHAEVVAGDTAVQLSPDHFSLAYDYLQLGAYHPSCLVDKDSQIGFAAVGITNCDAQMQLEVMGEIAEVAQCLQAVHPSGENVTIGEPLLYGDCTKEEVQENCMGFHHGPGDLSDSGVSCRVWFPYKQNNRQHRRFVAGSCDGFANTPCGEVLGNNHCGPNGTWSSCEWDGKDIHSVQCECVDGFAHKGVPFNRTVDVDGKVTVGLLQQAVPRPCSGRILQVNDSDIELLLELGGNATVSGFVLCYPGERCVLWNATCNSTAPENYTVGAVDYPPRLAGSTNQGAPAINWNHLSEYAFQHPCVFIPDELVVSPSRRRLLTVEMRPRPCTPTEVDAFPRGLGSAYCDFGKFAKKGGTCLVNDADGSYLEDSTQCVRSDGTGYSPSFMTFGNMQDLCGATAIRATGHCLIDPHLNQKCDLANMNLTTSCTCLEPSLRNETGAPCAKAYSIQTAHTADVSLFCGVGAASATLRCDIEGVHCFEAHECVCLETVTKLPPTKEVPGGYCPAPHPVTATSLPSFAPPALNPFNSQTSFSGRGSRWGGGTGFPLGRTREPLASLTVASDPPASLVQHQDEYSTNCADSGACGALTASAYILNDTTQCVCEFGAGYRSASHTGELPCSRYVRGCTVDEATSICGAKEAAVTGSTSLMHKYECRIACLWDKSRKSGSKDCELVPGTCSPLPGHPADEFSVAVDDWRECENGEAAACTLQASAITGCRFYQPTQESFCSCNSTIAERLSDGRCALRFGSLRPCTQDNLKQCDRLDLLDCKQRLWWLPSNWAELPRSQQIGVAGAVHATSLIAPYKSIPDSAETWVTECSYTPVKLNATSMWDTHKTGGPRVVSAATAEYLGSITHAELSAIMMSSGQCRISKMNSTMLSCSGWGYCNFTATDNNPEPVMDDHSFLRSQAMLPRMSANVADVVTQSIVSLFGSKSWQGTHFMNYDTTYAFVALKEVLIPFDVLKEPGQQTNDAKCYFGSVFKSLENCHMDSQLEITCIEPNTSVSKNLFGHQLTFPDYRLRWTYSPEEGAASFLTHVKQLGAFSDAHAVPWAATGDQGVFRYWVGNIGDGQNYVRLDAQQQPAHDGTVYYASGVGKSFIKRPAGDNYVTTQVRCGYDVGGSGSEPEAGAFEDSTYSYIWQSLDTISLTGEDTVGTILRYPFNRTSVYPVSANHMPNAQSNRFLGDPDGYTALQTVPYATMITPIENPTIWGTDQISYRTHDSNSHMFPFDFDSPSDKELVLNSCPGYVCKHYCPRDTNQYGEKHEYEPTVNGIPSAGCRFGKTLYPYEYFRYTRPDYLGPIATPVGFPIGGTSKKDPPGPQLQVDGYRMCVSVSATMSDDPSAYNSMQLNATGMPPYQMTCGSAVVYQSNRMRRDPYGFGTTTNLTFTPVYDCGNSEFDAGPWTAAFKMWPQSVIPANRDPASSIYSRESMAECFKVRSIESYRIEELVGGVAVSHSTGRISDTVDNIGTGYSPWSTALFTATCECMPGFCGPNCEYMATGTDELACSDFLSRTSRAAANVGAIPGSNVNNIIYGSAAMWRNDPSSSQCGPHGRYWFDTDTQTGTCICETGYVIDKDLINAPLPGGVAFASLCVFNGTVAVNSTVTCIADYTIREREDHTCLCKIGYTGANCGIPILCPGGSIVDTITNATRQCNGHGTCNFLTSPPSCECDKGPNSEFYGHWTGAACDEFVWGASDECASNGGSVARDIDTTVCNSCPMGRSGRLCEISTIPTYNGTECNGYPSSNGTQCVCNVGRNTAAGCACEIPLQDFCVPPEDRGNADCFGPRALRNASGCPFLCSGYGRCTRNGVFDEYSCDCIDGYEGEFCAESICPGACSGHGTCNATNAVCECTCDLGSGCWAGDDCSVSVVGSCNNPGQGVSAVNHLCNNHGSCVPDDDNSTNYRCVCDEGYETSLTENPYCTVAECELDCGPNGFCSAGRTSSSCQCYPPWKGDDCLEFACLDDNGEEVDAAEPVSVNRSLHTYECLCVNRTLTLDSGCLNSGCEVYEPTGSLCGPVYDDDPVSGSFVGHSCLSVRTLALCVCTAAGYEPDPDSGMCKPMCPVETSNKPVVCNDGGKDCFNGQDGQRYRCVCKDANYTSSSKCTERVCGDHGHVDVAGSCVCDRGYTGAACQHIACAHGSLNATGYCECDSGWDGDLCEDNECRDHGTPSTGSNQTCLCDPGWSGATCTDAVVPVVPVQPSTGTTPSTTPSTGTTPSTTPSTGTTPSSTPSTGTTPSSTPSTGTTPSPMPSTANASDCVRYVHSGGAMECVCALPYISLGDHCEDGCFPGGVANGTSCDCESGYIEEGQRCVLNCTNGGEFVTATSSCACPGGFVGERCETPVVTGGDDPPYLPGKNPDNRCKDSSTYVAPTVGSAPGATETGAPCVNNNVVVPAKKSNNLVAIIIGAAVGGIIVLFVAYLLYKRYCRKKYERLEESK